MKLGMIVRADLGRGLAEQTRTFYDALRPQVVVGVDMSLVEGTRPYPYPQFFGTYPDAIWTQWRGYTAPFKNRQALDALAECDVVYSAETYYDERLPTLTKTVLHVNPEFWRDQDATQYWYPTNWLSETLPKGHYVPTPLRDEDVASEVPDSSVMLHISGHRAAGDRNGTHVVNGIFSRVPYPWRITSQSGMKLNPRVMGFVQTMGSVENRWELYEDCGILVYPRRYGGQSLIVNEAMARGLAVVMGDNTPNPDTWPIVACPSRPGGFIKTPAGRLQMHMLLTRDLEEILKGLIRNPETLREAQQRSLDWARANTWKTWLPAVHRLLEDAAS